MFSPTKRDTRGPIAPRKETIHMSDGSKPWAINIPLADFIGRLLSPKELKDGEEKRQRANYSPTRRGRGRKAYLGVSSKNRRLLKDYDPRANLQAQRETAKYPEKYMNSHARRRYLREKEKENARLQGT